MVGEVEPKPVGVDDTARLVHVIAKQCAQRRVKQVRGRVIARDVSSASGCDLRDHPAHAQRSRQLPKHRDAAVHFLDIIHTHLPAITNDRARVGNLAARLCVERRLAENQRHPVGVKRAPRSHLRLDFGGFVAHELLLLDPRRRMLPARCVGEFVDHDVDALGLALVLRLLPLPRKRDVKPGDIDREAALVRHQFGEIDRKSKGVVELERIVAGDGAPPGG